MPNHKWKLFCFNFTGHGVVLRDEESTIKRWWNVQMLQKRNQCNFMTYIHVQMNICTYGRTHDNIIVNAMYMWNKVIKISFANLKHFLSFGVILFHLDLNNC